MITAASPVAAPLHHRLRRHLCRVVLSPIHTIAISSPAAFIHGVSLPCPSIKPVLLLGRHHMPSPDLSLLSNRRRRSLCLPASRVRSYSKSTPSLVAPSSAQSLQSPPPWPRHILLITPSPLLPHHVSSSAATLSAAHHRCHHPCN
ncbi:hypothetical protein M0R45_000363 [Rubus argutus]|uniref:Uncharacterized protein n=1 Tax=Rubus argutus TaxID=59490 RepID=A0AAW1VPH8_RUBAR